MAIYPSPVGLKMDVSYPAFRVLTLLSADQLKFEIKEWPFARIETVDIRVDPLGNSIFAVRWQEKDGATVTNVQDYDRGVVHSFATLPDGQFLRMTGSIAITRPAGRTSDDRPHRNRALVLEAMALLFQRRDASSVDRLYVQDYIRRNPHIPQGRDALRSIVETLPPSVRCEPGIVAQGDLVPIHGRVRGWAEEPQIVVDILRVDGGRLAEHWDVMQDEARAASGTGGLSMFDLEESGPAGSA